MQKIGEVTVSFILNILTTILRGFVIVKMWEWFVIPTFGVFEIELIQAIGISTFISFLFNTPNVKDYYQMKEFQNSDVYKWYDKAIVSSAWSLIGLVIGYIIQLFM